MVLRKEDIKEILTFGLPLLPHALAAWVVFSLNKIFIANRVGMEEAGLYSLAYQISMSISIFASSFNKAWAPYLFRVLKDDSEREKIKVVKITYFYIIFIHLLCVMLYLCSPLLLNLFFNPSYYGSLKYIPWISFGLAANGVYLMVTNYIFYVKKTYFLTYSTIFSALLHITLNYCVVDTYGALGCAISMMVSFYVYFLLVFIIAQRLNPMPWLFWRRKRVIEYA
ncbi:MAG: oligosaccharide flippase family protein [Alphaproteobacteria bacterium]|nr:oligosaccharide flippase family protein [Alphaproteobacteria bacterium]